MPSKSLKIFIWRRQKLCNEYVRNSSLAADCSVISRFKLPNVLHREMAHYLANIHLSSVALLLLLLHYSSESQQKCLRRWKREKRNEKHTKKMLCIKLSKSAENVSAIFFLRACEKGKDSSRARWSAETYTCCWVDVEAIYRDSIMIFFFPSHISLPSLLGCLPSTRSSHRCFRVFCERNRIYKFIHGFTKMKSKYPKCRYRCVLIVYQWV